jgi:hypothetical protein
MDKIIDKLMEDLTRRYKDHTSAWFNIQDLHDIAKTDKGEEILDKIDLVFKINEELDDEFVETIKEYIEDFKKAEKK